MKRLDKVSIVSLLFFLNAILEGSEPSGPHAPVSLSLIAPVVTLDSLRDRLVLLDTQAKKLASYIEALRYQETSLTLTPTPVMLQCNLPVDEVRDELQRINLEAKITRAFIIAYTLKGTRTTGEMLAWYHLLPRVLQKVVFSYYNTEDPFVVDYHSQAWWFWKKSYRDHRLKKRKFRNPSYSLSQQVFLTAFFNEYNRGECDLPSQSDTDVYRIYSSLNPADRALLKLLQNGLPSVHVCPPTKSICFDHVENTYDRSVIPDVTYQASYPRVMHIDDRGNLLLLHAGRLLRKTLLVRTPRGKQYHLDRVAQQEQLYGALWCNEGKYIVGIKKICACESFEEDLKHRDNKNNQYPQDLDIPAKKTKKKKAFYERDYSSSTDSSIDCSCQDAPLSSIQCTLWSWPGCVKQEEAIVTNNFNRLQYHDTMNEQHNILHNYMFARYEPGSREITFIIPPYKRKWHYSFSTKTMNTNHMDALCDGVVMSNGLKFAICPKGPVIQYGKTNVEDKHSFAWWKRLVWKTYHSSKQLRAYNVTDQGEMRGITTDGIIIDLPLGTPIASIKDRSPSMRDDWPVIFSPNNNYMMVPTWSTPLTSRYAASSKAYRGEPMLNTKWILVKMPPGTRPLVSSLEFAASSSSSPSFSSSSSYGLSSSSSASSSSSETPPDCCTTM